MAHYLDPKNDFIFKRIFGNHPDLLISFLNALMPFGTERTIKSVEYIPNEIIPENPAKKHSIVDVRCTDNFGRHFIVEMQMQWNNYFPSRMLFNASKVYVQQLDSSGQYAELSPVYALGILNENFDNKTPEFYHHFRMLNRENTDEIIEGLEIILVELPKFKAESWADRKMAVLWLRFLKEIKGYMTTLPEDLLADEHIRKAVSICEKWSLSPEELAAYDMYMDAIVSENSRFAEKFEKGIEIGVEKGERKKSVQIVLNCAKEGLSTEFISKVTGLSVEEIDAILENRTDKENE
jgi:predicted transposase/invertase (TIGR01784 family)